MHMAMCLVSGAYHRRVQRTEGALRWTREGPSTLPRPVEPARFAPHPAGQAPAVCSSSAIASIFVTKSESIFDFQPGHMHA